jgi:ABC-type lipoprotein release transport system permease subunit
MSFTKIFKNLGQSIVWLAVLLIVMYFVLNFFAKNFSGNILGSSASWVEQHTQPGV